MTRCGGSVERGRGLLLRAGGRAPTPNCSGLSKTICPTGACRRTQMPWQVPCSQVVVSMTWVPADRRLEA
jgi:hypothetical protein